MTSIAILIRGALANALAFTGSYYLFLSCPKNERGMTLAIEQLQKAQVEWVQKQQEMIDFINKQLRLERKAEASFEELNDIMREYYKVFGHQFPSLPQEPVLSNVYTPSNEQHDRELAFIALIMVRIGEVL